MGGGGAFCLLLRFFPPPPFFSSSSSSRSVLQMGGWVGGWVGGWMGGLIPFREGGSRELGDALIGEDVNHVVAVAFRVDL